MARAIRAPRERGAGEHDGGRAARAREHGGAWVAPQRRRSTWASGGRERAREAAAVDQDQAVGSEGPRQPPPRGDDATGALHRRGRGVAAARGELSAEDHVASLAAGDEPREAPTVDRRIDAAE